MTRRQRKIRRRRGRAPWWWLAGAATALFGAVWLAAWLRLTLAGP